MKKIFSIAMAAVLLMASCVKENTSLGEMGGKVSVSFTANLPIEASRTVGDGSQADELYYAIYDTAGNLFASYPYEAEPIAVSGNVARVTLDLVKGQTYVVAFWAQNSQAPYTFNRAEGKVMMNYGAEIANDEKYDAFYCAETIEVTGPATKQITLRRPFAQINLGSTPADVAAAAALGVVIDQTYVATTDVYSALEIFSGVAVDKVAAGVVFDYNTLPANALEVNGVEYEYLAANYILANTEADVTELTFKVKDGATEINTVNIPAVNFKRNYRTNILGRLLTSAVDYTIVIDGTPEGDIGATWDGESISAPVQDQSGAYVISDAAQLAWVAAAVNGTLPAQFSTRAEVIGEGQVIKLASDIDLNGEEWTPIGMDQKRFMGILDGNGYTIRNLTITERPGGKSQAALIATTAGKNVGVRNLTIENANIACSNYDNDWYGAALIGTAYGKITIQNVTVKNSYISGNNKVGALIAHDGVSSSIKIDDCHVENVHFVANDPADCGSVGGLMGYFQGTKEGPHYIKNSSVVGCTFDVANSTNSGKRANGLLVGGIDSKADQVFEIDNCTVANNVWNEKFYVNGVEVAAGSEYSSYYEGLIGGERDDNAQGKVFINGEEVVALTPIEGVEGVALDVEGNYVVTADAGVVAISAMIAADDNGFAGKTVKLNADVDLTNIKTNGDSFAPLGSTGERDSRGRLICNAFKGTFDGQGHTIKGIYQSGWDMGYEWGQYGSIGLFAELENATVKNVTIESMEAQVEGGDISFIAGSATGTCVFEDITIKNSGIGTYNNGIGGIIGWSGEGNYTFKDIVLGSDVVLGGLWGSFDSSIGGVVGQAEPGATYNFENVTINCRIDAYNDCTASYDYYNYRMCGMIIGRCEKTTTIDGRNYPDLSQYNMTFNNVVVNYGAWMNYHYCEPTPGHNGGRGMRIEPGFAYGGLPEDFDHTQCVDNHYNCIPFDQLIGGAQYAVKGLREVEGVTVNYPAAYTCTLCGQVHNAQ